MTVEIAEPGQPLTKEQIGDLENELGAPLPELYRRFLLDSNGGVPRPNVIDVAGLTGTPTDVQEMFGIGLDIETSNICWYLREVPDQLPQDVVPVACDSGGNLFCVALRGAVAGSVIYVSLGEDQPTEHFVARSFDEFLAKMR